MKRSIDSYHKCDPDAMSQMSRAAIFYALMDMRHDIIVLHEALRQLWILADVQMPNEDATEAAFKALGIDDDNR